MFDVSISSHTARQLVAMLTKQPEAHEIVRLLQEEIAYAERRHEEDEKRSTTRIH